MTNVAVLIPAYNAALTLRELITGVERSVPKDSIIVVNDGSRDDTRRCAAECGVHVLHHAMRMGKGAAIQTGFDFILQGSWPAVITMDADLQHRPASIPSFLELYGTGLYDIIIGSRLHEKRGMPFVRILSNTITTFMVRARTSADIRDSQSGFRLIDRSVLSAFRLTAAGFEAETEFLIKAASKGFRFGSLPIAAVYGEEESHMTYVSTTVNFVKVLFHEY